MICFHLLFGFGTRQSSIFSTAVFFLGAAGVWSHHTFTENCKSLKKRSVHLDDVVLLRIAVRLEQPF